MADSNKPGIINKLLGNRRKSSMASLNRPMSASILPDINIEQDIAHSSTKSLIQKSSELLAPSSIKNALLDYSQKRKGRASSSSAFNSTHQRCKHSQLITQLNKSQPTAFSSAGYLRSTKETRQFSQKAPVVRPKRCCRLHLSTISTLDLRNLLYLMSERSFWTELRAYLI